MNTDLRHRFNLGVTLVMIVIALGFLFLATPLDQLGLSAGAIQFQAKLREAIGSLSPFIAVALLGAAVGLAELTSTFEDYPREAIATQWGQYLIWLNGGTAVLAFFILRFYTPAETNIFLMILGAGLGFPTLIRTNFVFAKQFSGEEKKDMGINLGWLYEQFQTLCKKQIDVELMTYRRKQVDRLLLRYPTTQELYQTALYTIKARATFSKDEENAKLLELQQTIDPKVPPEVARMGIGLLILEVGGIAYVDLLVDVRRDAAIPTPLAAALAETATRSDAPAVAAAPAVGITDNETLVKKLVNLSLNDLVAIATKLVKAADDQTWIKQAAQPQAGINDVKQKAPIAYYLVSHASNDAILREVQDKEEPTENKP